MPAVTDGSIKRYEVSSASLNDKIIVDVWVPEGYDGTDTSVTYPVIYAHDGQNLFDPKLSYANVAWEIDATATRLISDGSIIAPIIVGISNRGAKGLRANDYFPEKAIQYIPESERDKTLIYDTCKDGFFGDQEAEFVTLELKPLIDNLYRTSPDREHTFAMGSSMGGLASLYLMCEYPEVFGGAACLSTHWIGSLHINPDYTLQDDPVCAAAILEYMDHSLPSPLDHRLYLDEGTVGWDSQYIPYENSACEIARQHGYSEAKGSLMTYVAQNAGHNEWYWQQRVDRPLKFLLNPKALATITDIPVNTGEENTQMIIDLKGNQFHPSRLNSLPSGIYIQGRRKLIIRR